jgi:hypothetical protein
MSHSVKFVPSGRGQAQCPADPKYPHGIGVECATKGPVCKVDLPYPAPECGWFEVGCDLCGAALVITAAGRADDAIWVKMPCMINARVV